VSSIYFAVAPGFSLHYSPKQPKQCYSLMFTYVKEILESLQSVEDIVECLRCREANSFSFLSLLVCNAPTYHPGDESPVRDLGLWLLENYTEVLQETAANAPKIVIGRFSLSRFVLKGYWDIVGALFNASILVKDLQPNHSIRFLYNQALVQQRFDAVQILANLRFDLSEVQLWSTSLYRATRNEHICRLLLQSGYAGSSLLLCPPIYHELDVSTFRVILEFCGIEEFENSLVVGCWLHIVAAYGSIEVWRIASSKMNFYSCYDTVNSKGETVLMAAAGNGNSLVIRDILEQLDTPQMKILKTKQNSDGNSALHFACRSGDVESVKALADPLSISVVNNRGDNPSFEAWSRGNCEVVYLLRKTLNASIIKYNKKLGPNQKQHAIGWFHYMMKMNENRKDQDERNDFVFIADSFTINLERVQAKLTAGVDCTMEYLREAITRNKLSIVEFLLHEEPDEIEEYVFATHHGDQCSYSPLFLAAKFGYLKITELILEFYESMKKFSPAVLQQVDEFGNSLLHWAASHSWTDKSFWLAEKYSLSWSLENKMNETPLSLAVFVGKFDFSKVQNLPCGAEAFVSSYEEIYGDLKKTNSFLSLQRCVREVTN